MSKRDRHDNDRRGDRRDGQPDEEQQRHSGENEPQEGDSLTALKAILSKVAALLNPLQLTQDESIRLVEQLYGSVLETDVRLAGEADDTRKSSVLAQIRNATITREGGKIVVQYASNKDAGAQPDNEAQGGAGTKERAKGSSTPQSSGQPADSGSGESAATPPSQPAPKPEKPATGSPGKTKSATSSRSAGSRGSARGAAAKPTVPATVVLGTDPAVADPPAADSPPKDPDSTDPSDKIPAD